MITSGRRLRRLRTVVFLALVASGSTAHAQALGAPELAAAPPALVVRFANEARVPVEVLRIARQRASEIFDVAGVSVRWHEVTGSEDQSAYTAEGSVDLVVVLASGRLTGVICGANRVSPDALGTALVRERHLAYVFVDRIEALATRKGLLVAAIVGDVVAHEVGHLLLPEHGHARNGVMRGTLDARFRPPALFTEEQAAALRARLARP